MSKYQKHFPGASKVGGNTASESTSSNTSINFTPEYGEVIQAFCSNSDLAKRQFDKKLLETFPAVFGTCSLENAFADKGKKRTDADRLHPNQMEKL